MRSFFRKSHCFLPPESLSIITSATLSNAYSDRSWLTMASSGGQRPCLSGLSYEVISLILYYIDDPLSQFNVALTCKHLAYQTGDILQRHQQLHEKHAVSSDLDPSTVPTLLRSVLGISDPLMAWHVRTFEVWGPRDSWADWKTFTPESDLLVPADGEPISWDLTTEDRQLIFNQFWLLGERLAQDALEELDKGRDSAIKILLIKLLPRLNDLKFVRTPSLPHQVTALAWLVRIFMYHKLDFASSPGLASVRSLAVNVPGGPWSHYDENHGSRMFSLGLLRLPSLRDIYIAGLDNAWAVDSDQSLVGDGSSVEHIFIDNAHSLLHLDVMGRFPRGLRSLAIRGDSRPEGDQHVPNQGVDEFVHCMCRRQRTSMESLMLYNSNLLHDRRNPLYDRRSLEWLEDGPLRQLAIRWADVVMQAASRCRMNHPHLNWEETLFKSFNAAFPASIEEIVIVGHPTGKVLPRSLNSALINLIRAGDHKHLKAIYLEEPQSRLKSADGTKKAWFEDLVALGRERGIDVHIMGKEAKPRHKSYFPVAKDKHDLASGPWYVPNRENDDKWEVDVHAGVWRRREAAVQQE